MSAHTPGPWRVDCSEADFAGPEEGFVPVDGCGCCNSPWIMGDSVEERNANARLIAAAPDLLRELKDLIKQIEAFAQEQGEADFYTGDAYDAIKKAEGGE